MSTLLKEEIRIEDVENKSEEELSESCKIQMQNIPERILHLMVVKMRNQDWNASGLLPFSAVDTILSNQELSLAAYQPGLGKKFEDEDNPGFINYEQLIWFEFSHFGYFSDLFLVSQWQVS